MDNLFIYLIKSSFTLSILYLSYEFFFRKEAYIKFSRVLLLSSALFVILLPFFSYNAVLMTALAFSTLNNFLNYPNIASYTLEEVVITATGMPSIFMIGISLGSVLLYIYLIGVFIQISRFFLRIKQLWTLIKRSETISVEGLTFVYSAKGTPTFSFLKWIFIDPDLLNKKSEFQTILSHEKIHAQQGHSFDIMLAEILIMLQWFNPFAYKFRNSIKENHEYIADQEVISNCNDKHGYQLILLQHSSIVKTNILTHNFSYSLLKRRLHIMKKTKNPVAFSLRLALLNASLILIFFACSNPSDKPANTNDETNPSTEKASQITSMDSVYQVVDVMPEYIGGIEAMYEYIGNNIAYPAKAKKEGIDGRVFISFIVEKDGQISDVEILRGIGGGCDEEAVRVIKNMPDWTPGQQRGEPVRVLFRMPIKFKLQ